MCPRYYDVKTCVPDTRQVCKDVIKTKCKTKDKVRSKSLSIITGPQICNLKNNTLSSITSTRDM